MNGWQHETCKTCEYFDVVFGDCLSSLSDRFQTESDRAACSAYVQTTEPLADDEVDA